MHLTTHLHDIAAGGQTRPLRITAITALSAIGTDAVVRGLKAQVILSKPGPVRQATVHVIAQHDVRWANCGDRTLHAVGPSCSPSRPPDRASRVQFKRHP